MKLKYFLSNGNVKKFAIQQLAEADQISTLLGQSYVKKKECECQPFRPAVTYAHVPTFSWSKMEMAYSTVSTIPAVRNYSKLKG